MNRQGRLFIIFITGVLLVALVATLTQTATAVSPGHDAFDRTWSRTDQPVAAGTVGRTWMWGPGAFTSAMTEEMLDAPGGGRVVQYFDKSRMEITDPTADPNSIWYVTNGLLATELITGRLQLGLDSFEQRDPATINLAGDSNDPQAPTYAAFQGLRDLEPVAEGAVLTQHIDRAGVVSDDPALAGYNVQATQFVPETNHRIAAPFWQFMNSTGTVIEDGLETEAALFPNAFYATGFPITEAYWATVQLNGQPTDVLIQAFERRVLTYTPSNESAWQVEAGNVGRHYFEWRYGVAPPAEPPATPAGADPLGPTPMPTSGSNDGRVLITVANHAPEALRLEVQGPAARTIELGPCLDCAIGPEPPASCSPQAPRETIDVPAGNYLLISSRPAGTSPQLAGPWTFLPDRQYGVCFFVVNTR